MRELSARITISMAVVVAAGCALPPAKLRVEAADGRPAQLRANLASGKGPARPEQCTTPCEIELDPQSEHVLALDAADVYPVRLRIGWEHVVNLTAGAQGAENVLRIPLLPRKSVSTRVLPEGAVPPTAGVP